mgnify:CR=1 FL=1
MSKFKSVDMTFSMDGIEEQFEYNRKGGNWQTFQSNLFFMRDRNAPNQVNSINLTVSVFTFNNSFSKSSNASFLNSASGSFWP